MDMSKLEALSMQTLSELREQVSQVLVRKMRTSAYRGFEVLLRDERRGGVRVRITGSGPVNLTGYEIDEHGNHLHKRKWRVSPSLARVVPDLNTPAIKIGRVPFRTENDTPASVAVAAF